MPISYVSYIEKYFNYDYQDYLDKTSTEFKNFCFTEFQRFLYDGKFNVDLREY